MFTQGLYFCFCIVNLRACRGSCKHVLFVKAGHVCGDNIDLVDGQPTGSIRVSFGYMSTFEDCQRFLNFVADCFVEKPVTVDHKRLQKLRAATAAHEEVKSHLTTHKINHVEINKMNEEKQVPKDKLKTQGIEQTVSTSQGGAYVLTNIYIYPIKSCGAYEV